MEELIKIHGRWQIAKRVPATNFGKAATHPDIWTEPDSTAWLCEVGEEEDRAPLPDKGFAYAAGWAEPNIHHLTDVTADITRLADGKAVTLTLHQGGHLGDPMKVGLFFDVEYGFLAESLHASIMAMERPGASWIEPPAPPKAPSGSDDGLEV